MSAKILLTVNNRITGKTTTVKALKNDGMHIYNITAAQFERIRVSLGHGAIVCDSGRIDAYKRNGALHAVIDPSDSF